MSGNQSLDCLEATDDVRLYHSTLALAVTIDTVLSPSSEHTELYGNPVPLTGLLERVMPLELCSNYGGLTHDPDSMRCPRFTSGLPACRRSYLLTQANRF